MLLEYGNVYCGIDWKVNEKTAVKYSRVYYVYSGKVEYEDLQLKAFLKPGYLYIFPSTTAYRISHDKLCRLNCTFMHIDFFPSQLDKLVEVSVESNPALKHILCSVAECIKEGNKKLINAIADIFKLYCTEHGYIDSPDSRIITALTYIAEHFNEKISVGTLSTLSGYNNQYFVRLFKKSTGLSPYQYIISYRMMEAKKMLGKGMPVSHIANATGYSDIKTFSRSFRQTVRTSPSMYRKSYTIRP